jgi:hypothetical protein
MLAVALDSLPNDPSGRFNHIPAARLYKSRHSFFHRKLADPKRPQEKQIKES